MYVALFNIGENHVGDYLLNMGDLEEALNRPVINCNGTDIWNPTNKVLNGEAKFPLRPHSCVLFVIKCLTS